MTMDVETVGALMCYLHSTYKYYLCVQNSLKTPVVRHRNNPRKRIITCNNSRSSSNRNTPSPNCSLISIVPSTNSNTFDSSTNTVTASCTYQAETCANRDKIIRKKRKKWMKRRQWMNSAHRDRTSHDMYAQLAELLAEPSKGFPNFIRMSSSDFEYILHKISPIIAKKDTPFRASIPPKIRLAITLRFLATGDSYKSLHELFKISTTLISQIVREVCLALNEILKDMIRIPTSAEEWLERTGGFRFPHCLGAVDGICIPISYSSSHAKSIALLVLIDSDYNFMYVDAGCQSLISDGDVTESVLWEKLNDTANLPLSKPLPGGFIDMPYVFLGDGAFALSTHVMKPFPGQHDLGTPEWIFNQQLSQSRAVVENTFGSMSEVFRIFKKPMAFDVKKASYVTLSCFLLHNYLRKSESSQNLYCPQGVVDFYVDGVMVAPGSWREDSPNMFSPLRELDCWDTENAIQTRLNFMNYLCENSTWNAVIVDK